eukprot:2705838-Pyramimonas_sp.AAC.1
MRNDRLFLAHNIDGEERIGSNERREDASRGLRGSNAVGKRDVGEEHDGQLVRSVTDPSM